MCNARFLISRRSCRSPPNTSAKLAFRDKSAFERETCCVDDFGSGYDLIMLNAICHMFSEEQNREIFRRARKALSPNGRLVVQDFILNPDKAGPQHAALFSLNMLVGTDAGASYNESEYTGWMKDAGFSEVEPDQPTRAKHHDCRDSETELSVGRRLDICQSCAIRQAAMVLSARLADLPGENCCGGYRADRNSHDAAQVLDLV